MHYTYLLSQQQDLLKEYASLLTSKVLSITRKERLLRLSFDLLKEYPEKVTKGKLKDYLLANP